MDAMGFYNSRQCVEAFMIRGPNMSEILMIQKRSRRKTQAKLMVEIVTT